MASGSKPSQPTRGETRQNVRDQVRDRAQEMGSRLQEGYEQARESVAHGYRQTEGVVARHPMPSVLLGFGLGFGVGLLVTLALTERQEESWYERHVPESLRHPRMPEGMRQLAESIRELPDMMARRLDAMRR